MTLERFALRRSTSLKYRSIRRLFQIIFLHKKQTNKVNTGEFFQSIEFHDITSLY